MSFDKKSIDSIISANNDNSLAIFVGAGISKSSDTDTFKLPSWDDLINELKLDLGETKETDFLKIAQLYYLEFGEYLYYKKVKKYFPDYIQPSEIHKLIFEINPHIIITTNWDNILEQTIEDNAYIFDVVCSDRDLVKSSLQNKLIKMHGDFNHHNIVFKEDDYTNYKHNFPLIENYIKSILSTHTVLFLGYSYNDINLKHIIKWIQNHSTVRPPMFLAEHKENQSQSRYLENHSIKMIVLSDIDKNANGFDDYSKRTFTFLNRINSYDEKIVIKSEVEIVEYVLNKLKTLNNLNGLLLEQVREALSNCGFIYEEGKPILKFYNTTLTKDYNKNRRVIYHQFITILNDLDTKKHVYKHKVKIREIFKILYKAGIMGVIILKKDSQEMYTPSRNYLPTNIKEELCLAFDFNYKIIDTPVSNASEILDFAYGYYQVGNYKEAYKLVESAVTLFLRQRNYTMMFIAMFNRNILLEKLKFDSIYDKENKYANIKKYDLKNRFFNLPKDLQKTLEPIYYFIDMSFIYKYAFSTEEELKDKINSKRIIESGGFSFSNNEYRASSKHENLVLFVIKNKIMIDEFLEYKSINNKYLQIALLRPLKENSASLNRVELFTCIKYISNEELKRLLKGYYNPDSEKKNTFNIFLEDKEWLINTVLEDLVSQVIESAKSFSLHEKHVINLLLIISLLKHDEKETEKLISIMAELISNGINTIGLFQAFNFYIGVQSKLYDVNINENTIIEMIEAIITKFVNNNVKGKEYQAMLNNNLSNLYSYASTKKIVLSNETLIDDFLQSIGKDTVSNQIILSKSFILRLYDIANKKIKDKFEIFLLNIDSTMDSNLFNRITFRLALVGFEFVELVDSDIEDLNVYLEEFLKGNTFSTSMYTLEKQISYLINNKNIQLLNEILKSINNIIENYEAKKKLSIF